MKKSMILGLFITLIGLMAACKKDSKCDILYEICYQKDILQCSDLAAYQSSTLGHKEFFENYFLAKGITVKFRKLEIDASTLFCQACDCPTGARLFVDTDEQGMSKLEELGFSRCNDNCKALWCGDWRKARIEGGFAGINQDVLSQNITISLNENSFTKVDNSIYPSPSIIPLPFKVVAKHNGFSGSFGFDIDNDSISDYNIEIKSDTLKIFELVGDGFTHSFIR